MARLGKQAKILNEKELKQLLDYVKNNTFYPIRNIVMINLSFKAGLRAKEMASLRWRMLLTPSGELGDVMHLEYTASKGKNSGRTIPLNNILKESLHQLKLQMNPEPECYVLYSHQGNHLSTQAIVDWFSDMYKALRLYGCSSHSGRRTFVTNAAKKAVSVGCSLRDVQQLAGHKSLNTTQRYIEGDTEGKRKLVQLV